MAKSKGTAGGKKPNIREQSKNLLNSAGDRSDAKELVDDSETAFLIPETSSTSSLQDNSEGVKVVSATKGSEECSGGSKLRKQAVILVSFLVVFGALTLLAILLLRKSENYAIGRRRNVILMISDGFGPASETFARTYQQHLHTDSAPEILPLDEILVGTSRTRSSSSLITDSAAGATAFSCLLKTYNAGIAVDPMKKPCGTVLEAAKASGLATGLVVTSRVTHATPAAFSSHVLHRNLENDIALQQVGNYSLGRSLDLLIGGGRCEFLPKSAGRPVTTERGQVSSSCRADDVDVLRLAQETFGWRYIENREALLNASVTDLPLLGLFATDHMAYEVDRVHTGEPSLLEMTRKALELLHSATRKSEKGFFVMIEGSRIDMAAHSNDAKTHYREIMAYQETVEYVRSFVANHPDTVMISVSDHETGGMALGKQNSETYPEYLWNPGALDAQGNSTIRLATEILAKRAVNPTNCSKVVGNMLKSLLAINNATDKELEYLCDASKSLDLVDYYLGDMVSTRALIGWSTHGHSGLDVNLYSQGVDSELLAGNHENTDIGHFIQSLLRLDLAPITSRLANMELREWNRQQATANQRAYLSRRHTH